MKCTILLLLVACLQVSARSYSQTISVNLNNVSMEKALKEIGRQSGYHVFYKQGQLKHAIVPVSIKVEKKDVRIVLDELFKNQPLQYHITNETIVVSPKEEKSPTITGDLSPRLEIPLPLPLIDIKGKVTNEQGEAVEATVFVKGTNIATATDVNGIFILKNVDKNATLVITGVNIETLEIKVAGKTDIPIIVKIKVSSLNEVRIVSTGYQQLPKERSTGSFEKIDNELLNRRVSTNIMDRLEGITSGLVFNRSNPASSPSVMIRGLSTIFANNEPLIVLDNFPYDGNINNINPNDIESITILKDAAAASIWGARSGNGVVVITTKKGKFNDPIKIELNTNLTFGKKPNLYYDQNFLNAGDFIDIETALFNQNYYNGDFTATDKRPLSPVVEILRKKQSGAITAESADQQINALRQLDVRKDLEDYFYKNSFSQQHSVNLRGGANKVTYYFSTGFDQTNSNQVERDDSRVTVNSLLTFVPFNKLELTGGFNYIQSSSKVNNALSQVNTGGGLSKGIYPYAQLVDASGNGLDIVKDYSRGYVESALSNNFLNWNFNPYNELQNDLNVTRVKNYDSRLLMNAKLSIIKGLDVEIKYQYEKAFTNNSTFQDIESYYTRNLINRYAKITNGRVTGYNVPLGSVVNTTEDELTSNSGRGQINFNNTWNQHSITVVGGIEVRDVRRQRSFTNLYGYDPSTGTSQLVNPLTSFPINPVGAGFITMPTGNPKGTDRFRSFYSNAAYTFKGRYTLSASGRIDQSNLFGVNTNQKSVPLWSTGFKWIVNKESFYKSGWLPSLQLRVTYGYNGNVNSAVAAYTTARYTSTVDLAGNPYTFGTIVLPGNPELRWEKIGVLNIGADFGTRRNRLYGSLEFFSKKGVDIFGDAALAPSTGYTSIRGNFAKIKSKGFDITLNTVNLDGDFRWVTTYLISYAKDKVTEYTGSTPGVNLLEGRPIYGIYSLRWGGLDPGTGDPRGYVADTLSKNYGAMTGILLKDRVFSGPALPTFFGSFRNTFSYKSFSLSVNLAFKAGYYFRRRSIQYNSQFTSWMGNSDYSKRWQKPGDETQTNVPSMPSFPLNNIGARDQFYANSEILAERGDHIRIQDIQFNYELGGKKLGNFAFNALNIYMYVNNIGILWRANGNKIDPDYQTGFVAPTAFSIGLRAGF